MPRTNAVSFSLDKAAMRSIQQLSAIVAFYSRGEHHLPSSLRSQGPNRRRRLFAEGIDSDRSKSRGRGVWVPAFAGTTITLFPRGTLTPPDQSRRKRRDDNPAR